MYIYIAVSSIFLSYFILKGLLNLIQYEKPLLISVEGSYCNTGERYDLTHTHLDLNEFEFFEMRYRYGDDEYCIVSETLPNEDSISLHCTHINNSPYITKARVVIDDNSIDVTEKLIQVAGPQCNFHDHPINFAWLFPDCDGSIHIIFNDVSCEIDIKSNVTIDGDDIHIPLMNYDSEEDVCFE